MHTLLLTIILLAQVHTQYNNSQSYITSNKDIALTIYNNNLGVVKDTRTIKFTQGVSQLNFTDVAATIIPQTVTFNAINTTAPISILEQNYENNLADKYSILKNYIGKQITLYTLQGQNSKTVIGTLLSYEPAFLIQTPSGVSIYDSVQGVTMGALPTGLLIRPTLIWKVTSQASVSTDFIVSYRAQGFSWKATYIANLNPQQTAMDFTGWVTIDNNSGKRYQNALLKLIAGDVNTGASNNYVKRGGLAYDSLQFARVEPEFTSSTISDFHMYTLNRRATLNENQQKQVQFIPKAKNVPINKYQVISINTGGYSQSNIPSKNTIKFLNSKQNGLGIALPKGSISVNSQDPKDGSLQFIGVDNINHTPVDENITIVTGNAFDIVTQMIVRNKTSFTYGYNADMTLNVTNRATKVYKFEINLRNGYGDNCIITQTSSNTLWVRKNANLFVIETSIQPNSTLSINWRQMYTSK